MTACRFDHTGTYSPQYCFEHKQNAERCIEQLRAERDARLPLTNEVVSGLSRLIFERLQDKGCEIGNASVPIIEQTIRDYVKTGQARFHPGENLI